MRWLEQRGLPTAVLLIAALLGVDSSAGAATSADEPARRHVAPVAIEAAAPLVRLALPVEAYARSRRPRLADLHIVDATGEPVPFALLPPRADEIGSADSSRSAALYALPPRPSAGGDWASPLKVQVQGDRIRVTRRGGPPLPAAGSGAARPPPGGWLFDLGERVPDAPAPQGLRVGWPEPAEFSADYSLQTSPELCQWRAAGGGQLLGLGSAGGALTQPRVALPDAVARFVRRVWADPVGAPLLTRAEAVWQRPRSTAVEPPVELWLAPLPARLDTPIPMTGARSSSISAASCRSSRSIWNSVPAPASRRPGCRVATAPTRRGARSARPCSIATMAAPAPARPASRRRCTPNCAICG